MKSFATCLAVLSLWAAPAVLASPTPLERTALRVGPAIPFEDSSDVGASFSKREEANFDHSSSLEKRVACRYHATCQNVPRPANSRYLCSSGACTWACLTGYTKVGSSCVYNSASTTRAATTTTRATTTTKTTPTTTTKAATTTTAAAVSAVQSLSLTEHNRFRALHGAQPLKWNSTLAAYAQKVANTCVFKHSYGPYGENLAATAGYTSNINDGIRGWEAEAPDYDPNNPIYSHFTAMVWKATTQLGCAEKLCPAGSIFDPKYGNERFYVCSYFRPGNYGGKDSYNLNVQP